MRVIKVRKLFQKTLFEVFALFGFIGISTSFLLIDTVNSYLSEEYENNSLGIAQTIADASVDILLNRISRRCSHCSINSSRYRASTTST